MRKVLVFLSLLLLPLFVVLPVYAQYTGETVLLPKEATIDKDYFAAGETVTVLGTVNGDAYVAGGTVLIDGTINGDVLAAGGTVNIRGTVTGDIRTAGGTVVIASDTKGNVSAAGGNLTLSDSAKLAGSAVLAGGTIMLDSAIGKGANIAGGQVSVSDSIGGDVWAGVGNLVLSPEAKIDGNLHYVSENEAQILTGATIAGSTTKENPPAEWKENRERSQEKAREANTGFRVISLLSSLILGAILIKLFPKFMESTSQVLEKYPWKALAVGLLTYTLFPFVFVILLVTVLGIPLALILLFGVLLLGYLSKLFLALFIGAWIVKKLAWKGGLFISLVLGMAVYFLLGSIPVLNAFTFMAFLFLGTGALLLTKKEYYKKLRAQKEL